MKKIKWILILLNLIVLMGYVNYAIIQKEAIIKESQLILFPLAPVDPRSLMQGDYMRLNYEITNSIRTAKQQEGYIVVRLNEDGVAQKVRLQSQLKPLSQGEYAIHYKHISRSRVSIGADSFFFQEGDGEKYEKAEYGGLKVDKQGNSILVGLYDAQRQLIE